MAEPSYYEKAYEEAQKELADLLLQHEEIAARILVLRQTVNNLSALCESHKLEIAPSREASYLVENSGLPDEILNILRASYPNYHRATVIKQRLEGLGHDMSKYQNPLATLHMILKRLIEAGKVETGSNNMGEKLFRAPRISDVVRAQPARGSLAEAFFAEHDAKKRKEKA